MMPKLIDPQLDTNFLIRLQNNEPEFVAYASANPAAGLSYNLAVQAEFLTGAPTSGGQLQLLEQQYGIQLIAGMSLSVIDATAVRLPNAFQGDSLHRVLHREDARIATTAFLTHEPLATGDLQLYKRARDLGLVVDFIGSGPAVAIAAAYVPQPVVIPP
jgi:predicted nucleic acid-binding protein